MLCFFAYKVCNVLTYFTYFDRRHQAFQSLANSWTRKIPANLQDSERIVARTIRWKYRTVHLVVGFKGRTVKRDVGSGKLTTPLFTPFFACGMASYIRPHRSAHDVHGGLVTEISPVYDLSSSVNLIKYNAMSSTPSKYPGFEKRLASATTTSRSRDELIGHDSGQDPFQSKACFVGASSPSNSTFCST